MQLQICVTISLVSGPVPPFKAKNIETMYIHHIYWYRELAVTGVQA